MPATTTLRPAPSGNARVLTPDQTRAAIALAQGRTVTAAADSIGVHRSTLYNWFKDDPVFRRAVEEIRRERYERVKDEMRDLENLALARLRRILEDDAVPPAVQLRAAMLVLNRPFDTLGLETWHTPSSENLETTVQRRPGVLETPETAVVRQISTLFADQAAPAIDITRQNSTDSATQSRALAA